MTDLNPEGLEKAARALAQIPEGKSWPTNEDLGGSMAGTRDDEYRDAMTEEARAAVTAYLGHTEVTTVEELDALPVGSVCIDPFDAAGDAPVIICKNALGHWTAMVDPDGGGRYLWAAAEIAAVTKGRLLSIYRPTP